MSSPRLPSYPQPSRSQPRPVPRPVSQVSSVAGSTSGTYVSSSATAVPPPSLLTTLTKPTTEGYPATEVIQFLVNVVGRDVVSFRRNAQVSYLTVDRARDICDSINTHIKITEGGSGTDSDWSSFEKFSDAIDPVEDALFQLTAFTEDERTRHVFTGDSVHDCITSADSLIANREGIWNALNHLETSTEVTSLFSDVDISERQAERVQAQIHDDKTFLGEVIEEIDRDFSLPDLKVPQIVLKMIENLRELLNKISTGAMPPALTNFTLKTGLVVQGVTKLAFHTNSLDPQLVTYLRSGPIWAAASKLVELLNSTRDDSPKSMDKIRKKYDDFLKQLLLHVPEPQEIDISVPKSYIELLKVAGQVRRPFHSHAVALISLCRGLVSEFGETKNRTQANLVYLDEALTATLNGLRKAVDAVTELRIFNLDNFEGHPAYQSLQDAHASIKKCHDKLFASGDWSKWERFIADAIGKDKERMGRLNKLLETRPPLTNQERAEQIELTVLVYDTSSGRPVYKDIFTVEGSTRLSAVRWTVAGSLEEPHKRRARQRGEFVLASSNTTCDLHETVSQYTGPNRKCALQLTI